jgi:hypothetical protein
VPQRSAACSSPAAAWRRGLARLLFPFADVLCFFSDDLGGFRQTAQRLALWLEQSRSSTAAEAPLPGVVIVTSKLPPSAAAEAQAKRAFLWMLEEEMGVELGADLPKQLSAIDVVAIRLRGATWTDAGCRRVKGRLMKQSDQVRRRRAASRALYSATHMVAFLKGAGAHLARSLDAPFDFIHASRLHNPVAPDLAEHLSNFLGRIDSSDQLTEFAAPMIASTLLLDNYPPGAHGTCHPRCCRRCRFCRVPLPPLPSALLSALLSALPSPFSLSPQRVLTPEQCSTTKTYSTRCTDRRCSK